MNKSQKLYSQMIAGALVVSAVVAPTAVGAEETTVAPSAKVGGATAVNNVTAKDIVKVTGVATGDVIKVYNGDVLIGKATAKTSSVDVVISKKFPADATTVQVTRTQKGKPESEKTDVTVAPEKASAILVDDNVDAINNVKKADTVVVKGLKAGDVVKVYADAEKTTVIGKGTAKESTLTIKIPKKFSTTVATGDMPAISADKVYVTRTSKNELEGPVFGEVVEYEGATTVAYTNKSAATAGAETYDEVKITNNARKADTVEFKKLKAGDIVTVYSGNGDDKTVLGKGTVKKNQTNVVIKLKGDLTKVLAGETADAALKDLYFTVKSGDLHPSVLTPVDTPKEVNTTAVTTAKVKVNNTVKKDTVTVSGLKAKDTVKVYAAVPKTDADGNVVAGYVKGDLLGTGKVKKDGTVTITVKGGLRNKFTVTAGKETDVVEQDGSTFLPKFAPVIVTNMTDAKLESVGTEIAVGQEPESTILKATNAKVENNFEAAGKVNFSGLAVNEVVKLYADQAKTQFLGQVKIKKGGTGTITVADGFTKTDATAPDATAAFKPVYGTVTSPNKAESRPIEIAVGNYDKSPLVATQISTINNVTEGKADQVKVTGLKAGDIVTVYNTDKSKVIGEATVKSKATEAIVNLEADFVLEGTTWKDVQVTVKTANKLVSDAVAKTPVAPDASTKVLTTQVTTQNNVDADTADTVTVTGVTKGDVIKVYDNAGTTLIGEAQATDNKSVTVTLTASFEETTTANVFKEVYVTRQENNKTESEKVAITPEKQDVTATLTKSNVKLVNNVTGEDTVTVSGLKAGDKVSVYKDDKTTLVETLEASGSTVTFTLPDSLFEETGTDANEFKSIFITNQNVNKRVSEALEVVPPTQAISDGLKAGAAKVTNNNTKNDTVTVTGVVAGDVVKVYASNAVTDKTPLGTATATGSTVTVELTDQLGTNATKVYVSRTSANKLESTAATRIEAVVASQITAIATPADTDLFVVTNNVTSSDVVTVKGGVKEKETINIYDATGNTLLGTATVGDAAPSDSTPLTIPLAKALPASATTVLVGISAPGANEGEKVSVAYAAETKSTTLTADNVKLKPGKLVTTNLVNGDIVKLYKKGSTTAVKTFTIETGKTDYEISPALAVGFYELTVTTPKGTGAVEYAESDRLDLEITQTSKVLTAAVAGSGAKLAITGTDAVKDAAYTITGPNSYKEEGVMEEAGTITLSTDPDKKFKTPGTYEIVLTVDGKVASAPFTFTVAQTEASDGAVTATDTKNIKFTTAPSSLTAEGVKVYNEGGTTPVEGTYNPATKTFTATGTLTAGSKYSVEFVEDAKIPSVKKVFTVPVGTPEPTPAP